MSTEGSPLMDKLPPEVRIRIYKLVLQADHPLLLANKEYPDETRFDVTLFTVSKATYAESFDIFFEVNAIRLWRKSELNHSVQNHLRFLSFVRYLELVNIKDNCQWLPTDESELTYIIDTCLALPRIRTLTIAYDALGSRLVPYLESHGVGDGLRCIAIGSFQLGEGGLWEKVHFKHYGMVKAWQKVQARRPMKMKARFLKFNRKRHGLNLDHWLCGRDLEEFMRLADLPLWCRYYDRWRSVTRRYCEQGEDAIGLSEGINAEAFRRQLLPGSAEPWVHPNLGSEVRVRDLNAGQHGTKLLQWLSELLCEHQGKFERVIKIS
ncbi:hypothetical protein LTR85_009979 [Meristemomyces frigidus]|nr:hypothetical protein LTR85_009979 [Meristemomyces frigidus]